MQGPEQLSLSRLIEVSTDDFDVGLKRWQFLLLAAHSGIGAVDLAKALAKSRGLKLFDERRRLDANAEAKREYLERIAEGADEYSIWIRERGFQPLLRDLLVSQCVAFENYLKSVGVASCLASKDKASLEKLIFVPSAEFRQAHREVNQWWDQRREAKVASFIEQFFLGKKAIFDNYSGLKRLDLAAWTEVWDDCFRLRNAIVHSRARPSQQLKIGAETFSPFEEAVTTEFTLVAIDSAFRAVMNGFRLSMDDL